MACTPPTRATASLLNATPERKMWNGQPCASPFRCPRDHPAVAKLPRESQELLCSRSFARGGGLERWMTSCGVASMQDRAALLAVAQGEDGEEQPQPEEELQLPESHPPSSHLVGPSVYNSTGSARQDLCTEGLLGLYFSAHWCPPCHRFTPELAGFYQEPQGKKALEVVFVPYNNPVDPSKDTKEGFEEYYEQMPWCSLPFGDRRANTLKEQFGITKIPTLVVVNRDGDVVSKSGKEDVAVGLDPLGSVDLCLEAWGRGESPKLPEKPTFSFSMDDDF